jgi:hypothetical protein
LLLKAQETESSILNILNMGGINEMGSFRKLLRRNTGGGSEQKEVLADVLSSS